MESGYRPGRKAGALVLLADGELAVYLERGGRTAMVFSQSPEILDGCAQALVRAIRAGTVPGLTVRTVNGAPALGGEQPWAQSLAAAGFHTAPQGLRLRR